MMKKLLRILAKSLFHALAPSKNKIAWGAGLRQLHEASAFIAGVPTVCQIFARKPERQQTEMDLRIWTRFSWLHII